MGTCPPVGVDNNICDRGPEYADTKTKKVRMGSRLHDLFGVILMI